LRNLTDYLHQTHSELLDSLAMVVNDLMHVLDQIGFLKSQELTQKRDIWLNMPDASTQSKDRAASYSAADQTIELYKLDAEKAVLTEERNFLQILLSYAAS
jgi:hypothetical protein